eukprot:CAMPEP_0119328214 /NCGR_PEP_ID=MMETSP1333-20130426/72747_1 /TAXON_ID=418940 /ORGANISM="Scyphosphaera apsteinii, Strain RCC1455" /LENGTH=472 /DNA_ID=CAMNT_0007337005 /DNA_START=211 /DNA_END=1629 /DNA_ORIENTATION=+
MADIPELDAAVDRCILEHYYNHAVEVLLPWTSAVDPEAGSDFQNISASCFWHIRGSLAALLQPEFVERHMRHGVLSAISISALDSGGNVVLSPHGELLIVCPRHVYETLGLTGLSSGFGPRGASYCVAVRLLEPSMSPGRPMHRRLMEAACRLGNMQLLLVWQVDGVCAEPCFPPGVCACRVELEGSTRQYRSLRVPKLGILQLECCNGKGTDSNAEGEGFGAIDKGEEGQHEEADDDLPSPSVATTSAAPTMEANDYLVEGFAPGRATSADEHAVSCMSYAFSAGGASSTEAIPSATASEDVPDSAMGTEGDVQGQDSHEHTDWNRRNSALQQLHEWIGLVACDLRPVLYGAGGDDDAFCSSLRFDLLPFEEAKHCEARRWVGMLSAGTVRRLLVDAATMLKRGGLPWVAVTVWGFADTPTSWGLSEHACHTHGSENDYTIVLMPNGAKPLLYYSLASEEERVVPKAATSI